MRAKAEKYDETFKRHHKDLDCYLGDLVKFISQVTVNDITTEFDNLKLQKEETEEKQRKEEEMTNKEVVEEKEAEVLMQLYHLTD